MDSIPAPRTMSKTMIEAFAIGFASTAGMLALIAIVQNRHKIGNWTQKVTRYAIQEAR